MKKSSDLISKKNALEGYEKIRSVGKGAYGTAFLYRKVSSDILVVIKEINMIESTAAERQMAINEVQVLSILNHQNIIRYNRSFEMDGILMIEMEYADGGTLDQFLKSQNQPLEENTILLLFRQVVSAIRHMHDYNILHRDLKTANVFLMADQVIKVGDFGISKVMVTKGHADTILGTPYYISPEMCEGKQYDQKSDIWALGCILYEMACLEKTFEGSNLLVLVNKITKGEFRAPVGYSKAFQDLLRDLLQKDPSLRPTAEKLEDEILPNVINIISKNEDPTKTSELSGKNKILRSVLYKIKSFKNSTSLTPVLLPPRSRIIEVSASSTHCIALTADFVVFSWGEGRKGQLGHGEDISLLNPQPIESLRGKNIKSIGAGDGFSVFVSETGMLMTCGDGSFGCLGHGDWTSLAKPKLVEKLITEDIISIGCGSHHVVILSSQGTLYSWGRGQDGCLGHGHESNSALPTTINVSKTIIPQTVRCGYNTTMIISVDGLLYACGNNSYNKLGVDKLSIFSFYLKEGRNKILTLTKVNSIKSKSINVALGPTHTMVLTEEGWVLTMGRASEGQLGRENILFGRPVVEKIAHRTVKMISSGITFSAAGTIDNTVYFWGTRYDGSKFQKESRSIISQSNTKPSELWRSKEAINLNAEVLQQPEEILALYASPTQLEKEEMLKLEGIYTFQNNLLILVETSVPLVNKATLAVRTKQHTKISENEDADTFGPIPEWIKSELAESTAPFTGT